MSGVSLYWIPLLPLLGSLFNLLVGPVIWRGAFKSKLPRGLVHAVAVGTVGLAFLIVAFKVAGPLWDAWTVWKASDGQASNPGLTENVYTWIETGGIKIELAFTLDALSGLMCVLITFVGLLIHIYSTGYMAHEERYAAYFGYLNLFTGAMLILVLGSNLLVTFIGWEGVGLCSYLLIGFWFEKEANANAGRKAFIVNRIGDFAFLLGMFLIYSTVASFDYSTINEHAADFERPFLFGERRAMFACLLLFIGACGKSAQIPLYVWLPDAMAGPTPVSALIHAATMVTAGVYMVARLSFLYASSTTAMAVVAGVGALTALVAAVIAFAQTDFKKVLAYSTVSQLGFMFVAVGVGAHSAGIFHLLTHGFFKAGLFLAAGSVMHAMSGSGDIMKMGGLRNKLPWTHLAFVVYWLAICGIFPFSGFWSKDEILAGAFASNQEGWAAMYGELLWATLTVAALGTAFYMSRLYFLVFWGECRADTETKAHIHESPWSMTIPLLVLAVCTVLLGLFGLPHLGDWHAPWLQVSDWLGGATKQGLLSHLSVGTTLGLMGLALLLGAVGIGLAWKLYAKGPSDSVDRWTAAGVGAAVLGFVRNKLYVDELYDLIVIRPFRAISQFVFDVVDRFIIDLVLVSGSAVIVELFGRVARWFQNGQVQRYMVAVMVGAAAIMYLAGRSPADFSYRSVGPLTVELRADAGAGPGAEGAVVRWDFDNDGEVDAEGLATTHPFSRTNLYWVSMWLTDGVYKKTTKITKVVAVFAGGPEGSQ